MALLLMGRNNAHRATEREEQRPAFVSRQQLIGRAATNMRVEIKICAIFLLYNLELIKICTHNSCIAKQFYI